MGEIWRRFGARWAGRLGEAAQKGVGGRAQLRVEPTTRRRRLKDGVGEDDLPPSALRAAPVVREVEDVLVPVGRADPQRGSSRHERVRPPQLGRHLDTKCNLLKRNTSPRAPAGSSGGA